MIQGLRTVIYKVPDLAAAKEWYSKAFEIKPYYDEPFYVGFNVGGFELGLDPDAPATNQPGGVIAYWAVEDANQAFARLVALGAKPHDHPKDVGGGIKVASVLDPFGNIVGLIVNPGFDPRMVR